MEIYEYVPQDGVVAICKATGFIQALKQFGTQFDHVNADRVSKVEFTNSNISVVYNKPVDND